MPKATQTPKPATRTSRRLRSSQEPDASPLKEYVPPKRKSRAPSSKTDDTNRKPALYTPIVDPVAAVAVIQARKDEHITPYNVYDILVRPHLFPQVPSLVAFEIEGNKHASSHLLNHQEIRANLIAIIAKMTDQQKVDLLIAQRAKIVSQDEHIKVQKTVIDSTSNTTPSKKRPAPIEPHSEDDEEQEQRPARRVKVTDTRESTRQRSESPQSTSAMPAAEPEAEPEAESGAEPEAATEAEPEATTEAEPETTTEAEPEVESQQEQPTIPATPSRWTSWIPAPIARIFTAGGTPAAAPRTAPARRITNSSRTSAQTPTRTRRVSAGTTRIDASDDAAPTKESIEATQKTGSKRKIRIDDLEVIPRPSCGITNMDVYLFEDEVTEEQLIKDGVSIPSAKRAKLSNDNSPARKRAWPTTSLGDVSPNSKTPTPSLTADPHRAQPYTGTMFADSPTKESGSNVSDEAAKQAAKRAKLEASADRWAKRHEEEKRKRGITGFTLLYLENESGSSSEDDDGDATLTDSDNDSLFNDKVSTDEIDHATPKTPEKVNVFSAKAISGNNDTTTSNAPSSPTMPHAILPGLAASNDQNGSAALAKARSEAEKYKPKTPSGLRATSRLSSSPAFSIDSPARGPAPPVFTPANPDQAGIVMTGAGPVNIFGQPIKSSALAKPAPAVATKITQQAVTKTNATSDKVTFVNDGSVAFAIELANRLPFSEIPKLEMMLPTIKGPNLDPQVSILVGKLNNDDWYDHVPEWAKAEVKPDMYKHLFASVTADINSRHRGKYTN